MRPDFEPEHRGFAVPGQFPQSLAGACELGPEQRKQSVVTAASGRGKATGAWPTSRGHRQLRVELHRDHRGPDRPSGSRYLQLLDPIAIFPGFLYLWRNGTS